MMKKLKLPIVILCLISLQSCCEFPPYICYLRVENESETNIFVGCYKVYSHLEDLPEGEEMHTELIEISSVEANGTHLITLDDFEEKWIDWDKYFQHYGIDALCVQIAESQERLMQWKENRNDSLLLKSLYLNLSTISSEYDNYQYTITYP